MQKNAGVSYPASTEFYAHPRKVPRFTLKMGLKMAGKQRQFLAKNKCKKMLVLLVQ